MGFCNEWTQLCRQWENCSILTDSILHPWPGTRSLPKDTAGLTWESHGKRSWRATGNGTNSEWCTLKLSALSVSTEFPCCKNNRSPGKIQKADMKITLPACTEKNEWTTHRNPAGTVTTRSYNPALWLQDTEIQNKPQGLYPQSCPLHLYQTQSQCLSHCFHTRKKAPRTTLYRCVTGQTVKIKLYLNSDFNFIQKGFYLQIVYSMFLLSHND